MLNLLLKYIDTFAIDNQVYFVASGYSFHWEKQTKEWEVKRQDVHIAKVKSDTLPGLADKLKIDTYRMYDSLRDVIVNQIVFSRHFIKEAEKLLGKDELAECVRGTEQFYEELFDKIREYLPQEKPHTLKIVRGGK